MGALFRLIANVLGGVWWLLATLVRLPRLLGRPRWLRVDLVEPLAVRPTPSGWFRPRRASLGGLAANAERVGADPRVEGVVFRVEKVHGGWSRLQTLRAILLGLRKAGKRVVVHLSSPSLREYYVACAADEILVDESGPLAFLGMSAEATFLGGALAKAGARFEEEHRGPYKSFAETLTREDMSPAHREALEAIVGGLHAQVCAAIAEGRKVDAARAERIADGGPFMATEAVAGGIADGVMYIDEVAKHVGARRLATFGEWAGRRLRPPRWRPLFRARRRIRVVGIHGNIVDGEGAEFPRKALGGDAAARAIEGARKDRRVAAVVLHVDSRGGSASASDRIWRETQRCAAEKPVVACFDDFAASGGYYLACAATRIVAQPATLTGSIGVVAGKLNLAGVYEKLGLRTVSITRGEVAGMLSPSRGFSDEERRRLAAEVDALYAQFVRKVAVGRGMTEEAADTVAKGRVWLGADAATRGLVDALGGPEEAIALARELAGDGAKRLVVEDQTVHPRRRNLLARLASGALAELGVELPEWALFTDDGAQLVMDPLIRIR